MDISKIKLPDGSTYEIKDEYLRHAIMVLLGLEEPNSEKWYNTEREMECLSLGIKTIKTIFYYYNLTKKQKELYLWNLSF